MSLITFPIDVEDHKEVGNVDLFEPKLDVGDINNFITGFNLYKIIVSLSTNYATPLYLAYEEDQHQLQSKRSSCLF